jgi:hypothetical protein
VPQVRCQDWRCAGGKVASESEGSKLVAVRSQQGILAFGADSKIQRVFADHQPEKLNVHSIEVRRLWRETNELNLLRSALVRGLVHSSPFVMWSERGVHEIRLDDSAATAPRLAPLREKLKTVAGMIPGTNVRWSEAVSIRLEYRMRRLWMLLEPTVWFGKTESDEERYACGEFARERQARRYDRLADVLLNAWLQVLLPGAGDATICAFRDQPGMEAPFTFSRRTAFARRTS